MTNWELSENVFKKLKIGSFELPKDCFEYLKKIIYLNCKKYNDQLYGHIKEEYLLPTLNDSLYNFILEDCFDNNFIKEHIEKFNFLSKNKSFCVGDVWVNFQKKYEFNPPHNHSGLFSFVIFIKIPYDLKKEENFFKTNVKSQYNSTSKFSFLNTEIDGSIVNTCLDVDKSFEGKMIMFAAKQIHQVFPFYTSNDYRITVSGNIFFNVN